MLTQNLWPFSDSCLWQTGFLNPLIGVNLSELSCTRSMLCRLAPGTHTLETQACYEHRALATAAS